jgi:outer membrane protein
MLLIVHYPLQNIKNHHANFYFGGVIQMIETFMPDFILKRPAYRYAAGTFLFLFIIVSAASAETLEDAWKIALVVDHRLQASRINIEAGKQTLSAAKAERIPSLAVESGYTILNHAPAAAIDDPQFPVKQFPTAEDKSFSYKTTLAVPLFTGGLIRNDINASSSKLGTAIRDEMKTEMEVKLNVADAYVSVLRAKRGVEVAESTVDSLSAHVKDVTNFYEQGTVTKNDLLAAQVSLADARQRLTQALNNLNIADAAYNRFLGRPLDHEVRIDDLSAEPVKTDINSLTKQALSNRPELASLSEQAQALRYQAASVRSSIWPRVVLSGGYDYVQNKYQVFQGLWSATIGLKWELFDGGAARHNSNALLQKADAVMNLRADAASVIALQVRQASLDIGETFTRIEVTHDAVAQSEENLKVTRDRYREGVGTNTEVLDAETLRTRSLNNHYNAIYDAVTAKIHLRYAAGNL